MVPTTLVPNLDGIQVDSIAATNNGIVVRLSTVAPYVACPLCGYQTARVHSRSARTLADRHWNHVTVRLHVRSRKLCCDNPACKRSIFTESLPDLAARYARKTLRLQEALYLIGYIVGGRAGERVAAGLGLCVSPETLLRRVRQVAAQSTAASTGLRVVGVDDWALRKGHRYGTILVDLERRCLAGLLPDRSSESLAAWLKQRPTIEVVSRDRAGVYADGARQGAPQAQQGADRWHLLDNLGDAMQRLTAQHAPTLRQAAQKMGPQTLEVQTPLPTEPMALPQAEQRRRERSAEREACYQKVHALRQQGGTVPAIVAEVHVSKRTVQRFLRTAQFPERARRRQARQTDDFRLTSIIIERNFRLF